jgi:hypothetical protein
MLNQSGRDEVAARHGQILFSRVDVDRAAEFQAMLKSRFAKELSILQAASDQNLDLGSGALSQKRGLSISKETMCLALHHRYARILIFEKETYSAFADIGGFAAE